MTQYTVEEAANGKDLIIRLAADGVLNEIKINKAVYEAMKTCVEPVSNGDMQKLIAKALGIHSLAGGRCMKAASIMERFTPGYNAFNGWCALLEGISEGRKRFFKFNTSLTADLKKATMLTRQPKPISAATTATPPPVSLRGVGTMEVIDINERFDRVEAYLNKEDPEFAAELDLTLEDLVYYERQMANEEVN